MTELADEPRSRLNGAKLSALVRSHGEGDGPIGEPVAFGAGAALVADGRAWVLVDGDATGSVGPAMAWALRNDAKDVRLVCVEGVGAAARRAEMFDPAPTVLVLRGTQLEPAVAAPLDEIEPPPDDPALAAQLESAGLDVNVEHGMLLGELRGLELARIVRGEEAPEVHIGVGRLDREMTAMVHENLPRPEALARVVEIVDAVRVDDHPPHPLRDLAPERWLRTVLVARPELVGCADLAPAPSPFARTTLLERSTAAATGHDQDGTRVTVVTSIGVDLDLVATAADIRAHLDPTSRLVVVVPERDRHPLIEALVSQVAGGCELRTVPTDWRS